MFKQRAYSYIGLLGITVLLAGLVVQAFLPGNADAAQITSRSLTLEPGVSDGGSMPSGVVNHFFQFTLPSVGATNVGSIEFLYCTLPGAITDPCTTPSGLLTTSATLASQTGATGFTIVNTTNGEPYLTRTTASVPATTAVSYQFDGITNPSATNTTFFVRIATFASIDTTGASTDTGTVAASTATQIVLSGTMPESLVFCTGATISETSGVPDCTTATSGVIGFNALFSPTATAWATSQMAASTNAGSGYVVTVTGPTLTSGSNTVTAIGSSATTSQLGVRQFGMNVVADTTPAINYTGLVGVGSITPVSDGVNYMGAPEPTFGTINSYAFAAATANPIAISNNGSGNGQPTDAQIYTDSYIANVSGNQPAGTYTTTLTYICTPTF